MPVLGLNAEDSPSSIPPPTSPRPPPKDTRIPRGWGEWAPTGRSHEDAFSLSLSPSRSHGDLRVTGESPFLRTGLPARAFPDPPASCQLLPRFRTHRDRPPEPAPPSAPWPAQLPAGPVGPGSFPVSWGLHPTSAGSHLSERCSFKLSPTQNSWDRM